MIGIKPEYGREFTMRLVTHSMSAPEIATEQHFTPKELAAIWHVAPNTIRALFEGEDGVLIFGQPETRSHRRHLSMRIPASVAARVHRRLHQRVQ
jgi:hypothetical protein